MRESKKYYPFLDVLRAISILWVIAHHAYFFFALHRFNAGAFDPLLHRMWEIGFLGVDMFFVTSGFLITGLLIDEFYAERLMVKRFYARRFFKIVPHYFLTLAVGLGVMAYFDPRYSLSPLEALSFLLFFQNYMQFPIPTLAHTWSIAVEEHFYLVYPLVLLAISNFSKGRDDKFKAVLITLVFLICAGNMMRYIQLAGKSEFELFYFRQTHVRFDALIFGCLLKFIEPWIVSLGRKWELFGIYSFVLAVFLYCFFMVDFYHTPWYYHSLAYVASGSLIVAGLVRFKPFEDLSRLKFIVRLGRHSYGIYLWHYILFWPITKNLLLKEINGAVIFLYVVLSIGVGILSTITIERYFLNVRNRWVP